MEVLDGNQEGKREKRRGSVPWDGQVSELSPDSKSPATENNKKASRQVRGAKMERKRGFPAKRKYLYISNRRIK